MEEKSTVDGSEIQRENQLRLLVYLLPVVGNGWFGISAINSSISGVPSRDPNSSPKGMEISIIFASSSARGSKREGSGQVNCPNESFSHNVLPNAVKG